MASIEILDKGIKGKERYKVTYDIKTMDNQRHRKSKTFKPGVSKRVVENFKRQKENEYEADLVVDISKRTMDDFAKEYFEFHTLNLAPTTKKNYEGMYYNEVNGLQKTFGRQQLNKIEPLYIQKYINDMVFKGISPKTIKNYIMFLDTMFEKAIKQKYIPKGMNPVKDIDLPKTKKQKVEAYTEEELKTLLRLLEECEDSLLRDSIKIAIGTGLRRGEICALKIENFSKEKKEISITESIVRADGYITKSPKSDAGNRTISLPDSIVDLIEHRIREYNLNKLKHGKNFKDDGYILSQEDGTVFYPHLLANRYSRFIKKHSDEIRYLSLHKLRHTFASLAISYNIDVKALQETLGHSDATTTLNTYSHGYRKAKERQATLLDDNIFKIDAS